MTQSMRFHTPAWLLTIGLCWTGSLGMLALRAQQRLPAAGGLETIRIRPNVYVIFGAGGNITAHVGEDGVILVDSGTAALSDQVVAAVKAITPRPIRLIINTGADLEHAGGNDKVGAGGVAVNPDAFNDDDHATVLAHENVLTRMSRDEKLYPTATWPSETFTLRVRSMHVNNEALQVFREIGALSDGDSVVLFRNSDVIATGDILDLRHFPRIDPAEGGTIQGELDALNHLLELTVPAMPFVLKPGRTLLVPGHGRVSDYAELVEYRDMLTIVRDNILVLLNKGMALEQVKAANPTAGYRKRWGVETGSWTTDRFVETIYTELKQPKGKS